MRPLSVVLASFFVAGSLLAALLMVFGAWFPYENMSSAELQEDDWLALAAPVLVLFAAATLVFVVKRRRVGPPGRSARTRQSASPSSASR